MPRPWTPNRPGALQRLAPDLWTLDDDVPGLPGARRRMAVLRRPDGTLLCFNAVPFGDATERELLALGRPAHLVLPNQFHALDAGPFAARFGIPAWAPAVALVALAPRVAARDIKELPTDDTLRVVTVEGFRTKEVVLLVGGAEKTLVVGDLVTNAPHVSSVTGLLMRLVGFTGPEPKLPKPVLKRVGVDVAAVKALLLELAEVPGLTRLVPSHGDVVTGDVSAALRRVAETLSPE